MKIVKAIILFGIFFQASQSYGTLILSDRSDNWRITGKEKNDLGFLLKMLRKSPTGRKLLKKASKRAREYGSKLIDLLAIGSGSLTDTTLIRRFPAHDPSQIEYEHRAMVIINGQHNRMDAVLDLAHELTHFTYRMAFNPYEGKYNPTAFIKRTIEGRGGEVDAYLVECKVLRELFPSRFNQNSHCAKIMVGPKKLLSRKMAIKNFYSIGPYYSDFKEELSAVTDQGLPLMNSGSPAFISSAYGVPYPVAAMREYLSVLSKVCANDERRLGIMQDSIKREPANTSKSQSSNKLFLRLKNSYLDRCMALM